MPQRAQMSKHMRQTRKRTLRNRRRRKDMKEAVRQVLEAAQAGNEEAVREAMPVAQKAIDKAAKRGILHDNTAARRKARLVARVRDMLEQ